MRSRQRLFLSICTTILVFAPATAKSNPYALWDVEQPIPDASELTDVTDIDFHVIRRYSPETDNFNWLHGVALAWHHGKLFATFGHNQGAENTASEQANGCLSTDEGQTWGPLVRLDQEADKDLAVSHGVLLSHDDQLWAFQGAFYNRLRDVHTRCYVLHEASGTWQARGVVIRQGFWPMQAPVRMQDGNWIMAGFCVPEGPGGGNNPAAVAISRGDDLLSWDLHVIPRPVGLMLWGESSVIVDRQNVLCIARSRQPIALVANSQDFGRSWHEMQNSNLPMATSKPSAGTLSTGQRFLVCTNTRDGGLARHPLTIALSRPGQRSFSRLLAIRRAVHQGTGESHPDAALSYPYVVEYDGKLYIGYSNDGGRGGNRNSAELAVIPLAALRFE